MRRVEHTKENAVPQRTPRLQSVGLVYTLLRRRRRIKPRPARAVPHRTSEAGSGTASTSETADALMFVLLKMKGVALDTNVAPRGGSRDTPGSRSDQTEPGQLHGT